MSKLLGISKNGIEVVDHPESHLHFDGDLLKEVISKVELTGTFHPVKMFDMGRIIGEDHLVETDSWSPVFHMARPIRYDENGNAVAIRSGESRMTWDSPDDTRFVSIGLCVCNDEDTKYGLNGQWVVFTVFEGKTGEREPWDRAFADGKNPEGLKKSIEFWEGVKDENKPAHALSATDAEREYFKKKVEEDEEFFRKAYSEVPYALRELAAEEVIDSRDNLAATSCVDQIVSDTISYEKIETWDDLVRIYEEAYEAYSYNPEEMREYYC